MYSTTLVMQRVARVHLRQLLLVLSRLLLPDACIRQINQYTKIIRNDAVGVDETSERCEICAWAGRYHGSPSRDRLVAAAAAAAEDCD